MRSGRFPLPENAKAIDEADVYTAVYDFIEMYGLPAMNMSSETGRIFRGYGNRLTLPQDNEYAVMTIIGHERRGTTVEDFDAENVGRDEDGALTLSELILCDVQIDFYSDTHRGRDHARRRAQAIETVARSSIGPQFFAEYGMSCLYVDGIRDLSGVADSSQYVSRWSVTLRLSFVTAMSVDLPWFDNVKLKVENVDVHHPPKKTN